MCTIGNLFSESAPARYNSVFKQCDLQDKTQFILPELANTHGIDYVALTREKPDGTTPAWSGINEYGIAFVAADSYLKNNGESGISHARYLDPPKSQSVFDMYLSLISKCKTLEEATSIAVDYYERQMTGATDTDILLIADAAGSCFIEAYAGTVICSVRREKFFASTNHMRMIYGAVDYADNHSTYLRLQRAEAILERTPAYNGIGDLLRDKYYGESVWSICRSRETTVAEESPFYTQASVIFSIPDITLPNGRKDSVIEFVLNAKPDEKGKGIVWQPFSGGSQKPVDFIGKELP